MRPHDRAARVSGKAQSAGLDDLGSQPDLDIMDIIHDIPAIQVMGSWGGLSLDLPAGSSIETQTALKRYLQDIGAALGWGDSEVLVHADKLDQIFDMSGDAAAEFAFQFQVASDEQRHSDEQNESAVKIIRIRKSDLRQILREIAGQESDEYVTVSASDGEKIRLHKDMSGLATGWAVIANPASWRDEPDHPFHNPDWKRKDGDTVIGVPRNWDGSGGEVMTVADAYQIHNAEMDRHRKEWEAEMRRYDSGMQMDIEDTEHARAGAELKRMRAPESEYESTPTRQHSRRFEGKMRIKKSQLRRIIREANARLNEPDVVTPDQMYAHYKEDSWSWRRARNDFYNFAEGKDPDGIRDTYYSAGGSGPDGRWTVQDFKHVIMGVDGYLEEFE